MCQPVYSAGARRARPLQLPPLPRFRSGYTERPHRESVDRSTRSKRAKSSHRKKGFGYGPWHRRCCKADSHMSNGVPVRCYIHTHADCCVWDTRSYMTEKIFIKNLHKKFTKILQNIYILQKFFNQLYPTPNNIT